MKAAESRSRAEPLAEHALVCAYGSLQQAVEEEEEEEDNEACEGLRCWPGWARSSPRCLRPCWASSGLRTSSSTSSRRRTSDTACWEDPRSTTAPTAWLQGQVRGQWQLWLPPAPHTHTLTEAALAGPAPACSVEGPRTGSVDRGHLPVAPRDLVGVGLVAVRQRTALKLGAGRQGAGRQGARAPGRVGLTRWGCKPA